MAHILSVHILHCGDETQIVEAFAEHDFGFRGPSERLAQWYIQLLSACRAHCEN